MKRIKIKIRKAEVKDIPKILEVEKSAWDESGVASKEMFESRIKTFQDGTLVAEVDEEIIGVVSTEIVDYNLENDAYTWYEITDNGFIKKSHNPNGNTIYGVDMSVKTSYQHLGVGTKLLETIGKLAIRYNLKQGMLGGRVPDYHKYASEMNIEDYIKATINVGGKIKSLDSEIEFYKKAGLKIVKVIPNYYKDPDSLNYGILLLWRNPFYNCNKWYRWLTVKIFKI